MPFRGSSRQWLALLGATWLALVPLASAGSILREVWEGLGGTAVTDLTGSIDYPSRPTSTNMVTDFFEAPTDVLDNYGQRLHGYVVAPVTGNYTFWIASDDGGELWLSTDNSPANKKLIASVASWTGSREWGKEANQQSAPVRLEAGKAYYVAALMKEGGGGDNLAVRWLRPGNTAAGETTTVDEGPIPAKYLEPWGISFTPPILTEQPTNSSVIEGQTATFTAKVTNLDSIAYRWQRNGVDVPGGTTSTLRYGPVALADNNSQFRAFLTNSLGATNTTSAVLTVLPDTFKPTLTAAANQGRTQIVLQYSEAVAVAGATDKANYAIDKGVTVTSVASGGDNQTVVLTTSALDYNTAYSITVNNVKDQASTPNTILPNSKISFIAVEYAPTDIGEPGLVGSTISVPGGADVTGGGRTIGGAADQFHFGWQQKTGDFDVQVRVASLSLPDPFSRAGLMVRDTLDMNARFGGVFAGSPQVGCFFQSRSTLGGQASVVAPGGGFPANYPYTWLRLQRQGNAINGYASVDAKTWTSLGSVALSALPAKVYFGFAVSGDSETASAGARFRDLAPTQNTTAGAFVAVKEPLGPSSRATSLIISEIMYHPAPRTDGRNLEFVEIANSRSVVEDLTGWRLSGDIDYRFPDGFKLRAGECLVVAAAPEDIKAVYGITNVIGPFTGHLANASGTLRLRNNSDAVRLAADFGSKPPWPVQADGAGHSLVLARPSYGEANPRAYAASEFVGGSPGVLDPTVPGLTRTIFINEYLAHTDLPQLDYVELYNHSNGTLDLSGCVLTDDPATNRFRIPAGTSIGPRGFLAFDETKLGFRLNAAGERIFLFSPDGTQVIDAIQFGGQENGVASGRVPDGAETIRRLAQPTPGAPNGAWRSEQIVINEIMYNPLSGASDDEYIELYNRGAQAVNLGGWKFTAGIDLTFPANTTIGAGGFLVVAKNAATLRAHHPQLSAATTLGDYRGTLANSGERIVLAMPDTITSTNATTGEITTNMIHIAVAELVYAKGGRWGQWADGGGSSLELIDPDADPLQAANWADSDESQKGQWTTVEVTGKLDFGSVVPNRLRIGMLGAGECLVDDVELIKAGGTNVVANGGFESGTTSWTLTGNHSRSGIDSSGAASGSKCLHIRAGGDGDTGINTARNTLTAALASGNTATIRAKVRWLAGWPEVLFRLQGNWLELPARMQVPGNLGTPGQANSRRVSNAGPAVYDVVHKPLLPRAGETVVVTARVSDPDGVASAQLLYRIDPSTSLKSVAMRDDGTGGDEIAGDGVYSGRIPSQGGGTLAAFRISATDDAATSANALFPAGAPAQECLVRWGDPIPFGTFAHYHMWNTAATESARSTGGLDNTWRDTTLVYGNFRVVYNAGFRDKGSPWHGGSADFAVSVPVDDLLLGTQDRIFASTGNGGSEPTAIRSQLAAWYAQQLGIPYLHAHYMHLFRNGGAHREIMEDLEQPSHPYAERWAPEVGAGDLYKVAMWFEFPDDNYNFNGGGSVTGATIEKWQSSGAYKLARYRWMFQRRSNDGNASNYTNLFDLVTAINDTSTGSVDRVLNLGDVDQWMRCWAFDYSMGNWDAWSYNVGQNMYLYKPDGQRWMLLPWDIDFTFGLGDGSSGKLFGTGQDPVINRMYDNPAFQRMIWRAYQDIINGPFLAENFQPQIDSRRSALLKNNIPGLQSPSAITSWINSRRSYIVSQLNSSDAKQFAITTNGGNDLTASTATVTLEGTAPFAAATIEVNGVPYPITWTTRQNFRIVVPLTQATNLLALAGKDRLGRPVPGATDTITVKYSGAVERVQGFVGLNEVHYNAAEPDASFIELYNRSTATPFDLSGFELQGVGYTFPNGSIIAPNSYFVLVKDRLGFAAAYGANLLVKDEFPGSLDNGGEHLALVRPAVAAAEDEIISDLRYDNHLPWPTNAAGFGPSLQRIDVAQSSWRVANWASAATNDTGRVTPGKANSVSQVLTPFQTLWINEVLPQNTAGLTDASGKREPWIEIYNSGSAAVDLAACFLSDTCTNLTKWVFPAGTTIPAKEFLLIWADGEVGESKPGQLHTNFRLNPTNGTVVLARLQGSPVTEAVLDYLTYAQLPPDRSFGCYPDGEPRQRRLFGKVTPGASNDGSMPQVAVTINEFMTGNTAALADPADGRFDDWFELYNAGSSAVDLTSYTLTDNLTNAAQFVIPPGTVIPAGGYLLIWADGEPAQSQPGGDLHVNFKLSLAGEQLGLFAPDGSAVDTLTFGPQTNDVSQGRYPDGAPLPLVTFATASPRQANFLAGGNRPPVFAAIPEQVGSEGVELSFVAAATDPDAGQTLVYSLAPDAPATAVVDPQTGRVKWTPGEDIGPGTVSFNVRATDNGTPPRTSGVRVTVTVTEANSAPVLAIVPDQVVDEGSAVAFSLSATDPDRPANRLSFALDTGGVFGASVDTNGVFAWRPSEAQGGAAYAFSVRVSDDGNPSLSDTQSFKITVREVANAPEMPFIAPQTVDEGSTFQLQTTATDPDSPASPLRYQLETAPGRATVDANTGLIVWKPGEDVGPTNVVFTVRATEVNPPGLSVVRTFGVTVNEVNQAPVLTVIPNQTAKEGETVVVQAAASDADRPAQKLTYSLVGNSPAGLTIDGGNGLITWLVGGDQGASTNTVSVRVTDDGPGNLSDTKSFQVIVVARPHLVINEIMYRPSAKDAEFIELFNRSTNSPVALTGVSLVGASLRFDFPAGAQLAPGKFALVVKKRAAFDSAYGPGQPVLGEYSGQLNTAGDTLRLVKSSTGGEELLDEVHFRTEAPWPPTANGGGASLQLIDAAQDNRRLGNWGAAAGLAAKQGRELVTMTNAWRYNQAGTDLGATWQAPGYDDSKWPTGGALLYVEGASLPAPKTTPLTLGMMTYYFRSHFNFSGPTVGVTLKLNLIVDDGAVVYLNGKPLFAIGMDTNAAITFGTVANRNVSDALLEGPFTVPADLLVQGDNAIAVEVHQSGAQSSDIVFGVSLEAEGTAAPYTPGAVNSIAANLPPFPEIWLNEILVNNATGIADNSGEREPWLELLNAGPTALGFEGWYLTDTYTNLTKWALPADFTIGAGLFRTLWLDGEPTESVGSNVHASFRPKAPGVLALTRMQNGQPAIVDYFNLPTLAADTAFGSLPDGQDEVRQTLAPSTPSAPNQMVNRAPQLALIADQTVVVGETLALDAAATDPDAGQTLAFALGAGAPAGMSIVATNGHLTWTPTAAQVGSSTVTVVVTDNGTPPASASRLFKITVQPLAQPPVITDIPPQTVAEGSQLKLTVIATDPNVPASPLQFSLEAAPAGATIDPATGVITWLPGEEVGPTNLNVTVRVTQINAPKLSATRLFTLAVTEVNQAPTLTVPGEQTLQPGQTMSVTAVAADADLPVQTLTFSLVSGQPAGMTIDPTTGQITWTVPAGALPSTNTVMVRVVDGGTPSRSNAGSFRAVVSRTPAGITRITSIQPEGTNQIRLTWTTTRGWRYRVESMDSIGGAWTAATSETPATDGNLSVLLPKGSESRVYRVVEVP